jgi:hypothetical protein
MRYLKSAVMVAAAFLLMTGAAFAQNCIPADPSMLEGANIGYILEWIYNYAPELADEISHFDGDLSEDDLLVIFLGMICV